MTTSGRTNDNDWQPVVERMTTSDKWQRIESSDNKWQSVTANDSEWYDWKQMRASKTELYKVYHWGIKEDSITEDL